MVNYSAKSEKSADLSHPGFKLITLTTASLTSLEAVVKDQDQAGINQQNWSHSLTPIGHTRQRVQHFRRESMGRQGE